MKYPKIEIKNILAMIGIVVVLFFALIIGIQTAAQLLNDTNTGVGDDVNSIVEDDLRGFIKVGVDDCSQLVFGFLTSLKIPNNEPVKHSFGGIAIDSNGNILGSDIVAPGNKVLKFDSKGRFLGTFGTNNNDGTTVDIDVDKNDNIYSLVRVVPNSNPKVGKIYKFDPSGVSINEWKDNIPTSPARLSINNNSSEVYILDWKTYQTLRYTSAGVFIAQFAGYGSDIAIGIDDYVYITDKAKSIIHRFDKDGQNPLDIDVSSYLAIPDQIDVDGSGNIYITDTSGKLVKFDKNMHFLETLLTTGGGGIGARMSVDKDGNVYISSPSQVTKYGLTKEDVCGDVEVIEDTIPNSDKVFRFVKTLGDKLDFFLDDNGLPTPYDNHASFKVKSGDYTISQELDFKYNRNITCIDPTNNSRTDKNNGVAYINLSPKEKITCTFQNCAKGTICDIQTPLPSEGYAR